MTWLDEFDWLVDPWRELERMRREMDRLFSGYYTRGPEFPAVNIAADDQRVQVVAEIPGIDPDKLQVEVSDSAVSISGERPEPRLDRNARYLYRERGHGRFQRHILLPYEVDTNRVESSYRNGVLVLTVPRAEHSKPRRIAIKAE